MSNKFNLDRRSFLKGSAVAAGALGIGLTGCGGEKKPAAGGASEGPAAITAASAYANQNFTPFNCSSALGVGTNWHVVEGLYNLDMVTYTPYKALAADDDPVKISDTEYEVKLRDGAKFSDGTDVTAEDVVSSYERTVEPEGALYKSMLSFIDHMEAKDEKTVKIVLNQPFGLLKYRLPLIYVLPKAQDAEAMKTNPIGSGPWKYDGITETDVKFVANEHYNGDHPAKTSDMEWKSIKDNTARTTALTEKTVKVMEGVPVDTSAQCEGAGAKVEPVQGFGLPFLMFDTVKEPFNDKRVRQAFFYAIDVEKLIENAMGGLASPVTCFLPKTYKNYHEASTVYTHNTEKAKELLKEAGQENLKITLQATDHDWIKALTPQIKNDLEAAGMTVEINQQASSSLYSNWADVEGSNYDVALAPGDPSCFGNDPDLLMNWWYGDNIWTQKRTWWQSSDKAKFDELHEYMNEALKAEDEAGQQEAWNKCFDLIAEEVPLYPLFHKQVVTGYYTDDLDGFKPIGTTGMYFIDVAAK